MERSRVLHYPRTVDNSCGQLWDNFAYPDQHKHLVIHNAQALPPLFWIYT